MPTLTRWFVKASLVYFIAALLSGVILALRAVLDLPGFLNGLGPVYFHLFMVGWVSQLIFGVVYWMFPKYTSENPRRSESLAWATWGLINMGLVLRTFGEPLMAAQPQAGYGWILAVSAVLQWLAGLAFVANTWGRVKER
jgi:cbb3-type cytochrome oxidase subunit 1